MRSLGDFSRRREQREIWIQGFGVIASKACFTKRQTMSLAPFDCQVITNMNIQAFPSNFGGYCRAKTLKVYRTEV